MIHSPIKSSEGPPSEGEQITREIVSPSEGEQEMREIVSPSEGGTGMLEWKMRLYGVLAAVVHLRTFGRWAEYAGNRLTLGRWDWYGGRGNAAVWGSGGGGASTHLRKVGR